MGGDIGFCVLDTQLEHHDTKFEKSRDKEITIS